MRTTLELPLPRLTKGRFASISALSDESLFQTCGVRVAFTQREGGVSEGAYASLNMGSHVGDDLAAVEANRRILKRAFGVEDSPCIVPNQVHGTTLLTIPDPSIPFSQEEWGGYVARAQEGADAVVVESPDVAALLCFADCVPVIIVSPSGRFAVVHAGWRGVEGGIVPKAFRHLLALDKEAGLACGPQDVNVYIGPYIHKECFETGEDVLRRFETAFGVECLWGSDHVDLGAALRVALEREGAEACRIADADICTVCNNDAFFSYRAQEGVCGRHGAFAVRM